MNTEPQNVVPPTTYTIQPTVNGYLLIVTSYAMTEKYGVTGSTDHEHFMGITDLLQTLSNILDPGSRHDASRTYVIEAPGDKHDDFTEEHAKVIFGGVK